LVTEPAYPFRGLDMADELKTEKYIVRVEVLSVVGERYEGRGFRQTPHLTLEQIRDMEVRWGTNGQA
jgi:hypothetical protein